MAVFMARLRANFRANAANGHPNDEPVLACGDLKVDLAQRRVWVGRREVDLTPKEFELLSLLTRHAGKVLTHRFLLEQVWGPAHTDDVEYARVFIKQLREKIEAEPANPQRIVTETGVGYRLSDDQDAELEQG
jgi:two-component system KDP operon response regulator KdpE